MKCPYRKKTVHKPESMKKFSSENEYYMDCYKEECPFWGAIGMVYNVDNGLCQETETGCRRAKKECVYCITKQEWNRE